MIEKESLDRLMKSVQHEKINQIFGAKQFAIWLLCSSEDLSPRHACEKMWQLLELNSQVWKQIGDNVKKLNIDLNEQPALFDFNPFLWIKYCFENDDKALLVDVITLYSSILRRLKELVNLDPEDLEMNIANEDPLRVSQIHVGKYEWSPYILKAYKKFENSLPRPSRTNIIKWETAWSSYVRFINGYCPRTNLNGQMSEINDIYKNFLDPLGTDVRVRPATKLEREIYEHLQENIELLGKLFVNIEDITQ